KPYPFQAANARSFTGATQVVFLDFDSATDPGEVAYSTSQRNAVLAGIASNYAGFDYSFTLAQPTSGDFSTLTFNDGPVGGLADGIDFRNLDRNDNATVNINGLPDTTSSSANIVASSVFLGSHELGHIAGLRHGDSYGPLGSGIAPGLSSNYGPNYPGPKGASEFNENLMSSPASVGASIGQLLAETSFSARSAVKLAFNEQGTVTDETASFHGSIATAQALSLPTIALPNTALPDDTLFGGEFQADAEVVLGSIAVGGESDFYSFDAQEGDLFNFEVLSGVLNPDRVSFNPIDPTLTILDATGVAVDYFGSTAFNDDELETLDSIIIDLVIPEDGTFFVEVGAFSSVDTGSYELFAYRFEVVPEPVASSILMVGVAAMIARRRAA
ncbi:MAG: hypothetical protein AAFX76_11945, partial [Planctomycetota bacterium]